MDAALRACNDELGRARDDATRPTASVTPMRPSAAAPLMIIADDGPTLVGGANGGSMGGGGGASGGNGDGGADGGSEGGTCGGPSGDGGTNGGGLRGGGAIGDGGGVAGCGDGGGGDGERTGQPTSCWRAARVAMSSAAMSKLYATIRDAAGARREMCGTFWCTMKRTAPVALS